MMHMSDNIAPPTPKDGSGFQILADAARAEHRMVKDDQPITPELRAKLVTDLNDYRAANGRNGRPLPWSHIANLIGVSPGVLSPWLAGSYPGDYARVCRLVDQFLAEEAERHRGKLRTRPTIITWVKKAFATISAGIRNRTIPVIIGAPGSGKSTLAEAFALQREGVTIVRMKDSPTDKRRLTELLCAAIPDAAVRAARDGTHRARFNAIQDFLRAHRNTVLIVDECQKLNCSALELIRDLHDGDGGEDRTVIVLMGDADFYRHLSATKAGRRSPIAPQMIRRMIPVFDVQQDGGLDADGGGDIYTADDVLRVIQNERLRLVTPAGAKWLTRLANVPGYGLIGFALNVLQTALDLARRKAEERADVGHLQAAIGMTAGRAVAAEIDAATDGELLRVPA